VKDDRVYLGHIRDAINDIEQYTVTGRDTFMGDRKRQDAVIRKFEIIGEPVKHLSEETTQRRPDIPWRRIAGMRDRLTHDYLGVDLSLVWAAVERDLPNLRSAVESLLSEDDTKHQIYGRFVVLTESGSTAATRFASNCEAGFGGLVGLKPL
jgi:uncharacterized protein with HEPN domain